MRYSKRAILVSTVVVAILAILAIGLCIKAIRSNQPTMNRPEQPLPGHRSGARTRALSAEDRAKLKEEKEKKIKQMADMSEEEKEKFRAMTREQFSVWRFYSQRFHGLSDEDRAKLIEQWENLSEEEKQALKAKMRAEFTLGLREGTESSSNVSVEEKSEQQGQKKDTKEQQQRDSEK